jgi:RNA-dependent RNA polymerase
MYKKNTMMTMYTTEERDDVDFIVDLRRRLLVACFKFWIEQQSVTPPSSDDEEVEEQGTLARLESYRFRIPFGHLEKLLEQPLDISSPTERSLIIPLPSPPQFWRKLHNLTRAHEEGSSFWTADDEWFRQTAIVYDPREMSDALSLNQEGCMLEIGTRSPQLDFY